MDEIIERLGGKVRGRMSEGMAGHLSGVLSRLYESQLL